MAQAIKGAFNMQIRRLFGTTRFYCKNLQDYNSKYLQGTDFLLSNLKNANNTKTVLEMVSQHNSIMNNKHIIQALRSLFTLQKNGESDLSTKEILANKDFRKLCKKLKSQAPSIDLGDTIEALKVISYVGVSSDTTIFQVLLQLIRHNVNKLSLQQIIFLEFLLSHATPSPLVDALKIALPMVFEINLPIKMDYDNATHLAEYLYFASRNSFNFDSVQKIVTALEAYPEFDAKTAKSVVWSICEFQGNDMFQFLMQKAIKSMVIHLDELNFGELESTLTKLIARVSRRFGYFYDETFFDSCANYVIDKDLGYKQSIYILRKFARVNFFHKFLLDYMCRKVEETPEIFESADGVDLYSIAVATSMTDYRPTNWENLKERIRKFEKIVDFERKEIIWIKFGAALCLLDIYKLDILTKCLNETFLRQLFLRKRFMSDFENYVTIWQSIKLFRPEFNCLLPKEYDPEVLIKSFKQDLEFPLEGALHKAFGGEGYVKTDVYSKTGVQIDHAVVFRKGGFPVAMNYSDETEFVEDIEVPPENQLVVFLGLRHFNFTLNNKRLRDNVNLNIKVLESQGYQVIPVDLEVWQGLPDFEKIPYIMRTIKERTFSDLKVSESVV